ncbi:MAG: hypothetical protein NXH75_07995 [Halobacteriovoraceae bacterium]|nr:hypothetical protein [Halobacteriovoraceae bacterium]
MDTFFLNSDFSRILPEDPHSLFIINLFFGLPHIVAGNIQLADRQYLSHHRIGLIVCLVIGLAFPYTLISQLGLGAFITVEFVIAAFHTSGQQVGIAKMFSKFDTKFYSAWKWSSRLALSLTALRMIQFEYLKAYFEGGLDYVIGLFILINLLTGLHMIKGAKEKVGLVYIAINSLTTIAFFYFQLWGYAALSILILRIPHDTTAFLFYMNHSRLRNKEKHNNFVVKLLNLSESKTGYFLPFLAVPLALFIQQWEFLFLLDAFLSFLHYSSETFIWKSGSFPIRFIKMS